MIVRTPTPSLLPTMPSSRSTASAVLKCPTCNAKHHPKTDVFCNLHKGGHEDEDGNNSYNDYDARQLFGITSTCPITLEECSNLVVLPCGHVLSYGAYHSLGGYLPRTLSCSSSRVSIDNDGGSNNDEDDDDTDGGSSSILVHIRHAGQAGVNGTYRKHYNKNNIDSSSNNNNTNNNNANRYTSIGRYDNQDVEYCIDLRTVTTTGGSNGNIKQRIWYISCQPLGAKNNNNPTSAGEPFKTIDFYKGRVNDCMYPHNILWEPASLAGTYPAPRSVISHFA